MGEFQKAIDDCKTALKYDPNYGKAFGRLGLAYSKMNRHSEAIDAYRNALRIEPDNQDYKNNMEVTQQRLDGNSNQNLHLYFKLSNFYSYRTSNVWIS